MKFKKGADRFWRMIRQRREVMQKRTEGKSSHNLNLICWFKIKILKCVIFFPPQKPKSTQLPLTTLVKLRRWIEPLPHSNLDVSQPSVWRLHAVCEEDDLLVPVCDCSKGDGWKDEWGGWEGWGVTERNWYNAGETEFEIPKIHHQGSKSVTKGKVQCDDGGRSKWFQHPVTIHRSPSRGQLRDLQHLITPGGFFCCMYY